MAAVAVYDAGWVGVKGEWRMQSIPVLHVCERSLAAAYEQALVALYRAGIPFKTQYVLATASWN